MAGLFEQVCCNELGAKVSFSDAVPQDKLDALSDALLRNFELDLDFAAEVKKKKNGLTFQELYLLSCSHTLGDVITLV